MSTWYNERALMLIENYIYQLRKPRISMKRDVFIHSSYSIWAAEELMKYLQEHSYIPPLECASNFIKKMDDFSCMNTDTSYIFSIASDTAKDILDMLLTYI